MARQTHVTGGNVVREGGRASESHLHFKDHRVLSIATLKWPNLVPCRHRDTGNGTRVAFTFTGLVIPDRRGSRLLAHMGVNGEP